ncbi:hypothetical protein SprV_0502022800 [Sparganum proliferum]
MAESDETIPLKDRYESLKLLCREQVLANELLKDEIERLRKCFEEVSKHRTYLLEKLLSCRHESSAAGDTVPCRQEQFTQSMSSERRPSVSQHLTSVAPSSTSRRNKGSHNELSLDGSDADNDSWHGDYDNGWDDGLQTPNYRRSVKRHPKSMSGPKAGHQPDNGSGTPQAFKKPRMNSVMSSVSRDYYPATTSLSTRPADDFCEEPPLIYSSARGKPSALPPMSDAPMEFRSQPSTAAAAPPPQTKSRQGDLVGARPISKMAGHSPKTATILTSPNAVHVSRATSDNACIDLTRSPVRLPVRICTVPDFGPPQFCFYGF